MASYLHIEKSRHYKHYLGFAGPITYTITKRGSGWHAQVGERFFDDPNRFAAAPITFRASTLELVDARLSKIASEIAAHRAPNSRRPNTSNGDGTRTVSMTKEQTIRQAKSIADLANLRVLPHIEEMRDLAVVYAAAAQERAVAVAELAEDPFNKRLLALAQKAHDAYIRARDNLQYALRVFPLI